MCGIVGYVGENRALPFLLSGLNKLEYRGYDSSGIAIYNDGKLDVIKAVGRLKELENKIEGMDLCGHVGIGHTRWATHGRPSEVNSHPHTDCKGDIAVIHNGIIENYMSLKSDLEKAGHVFKSETDTEVVAHLVESNYRGDIVDAVRRSIKRLKGAYSLVFVCRQEPEKIVAAKKDSPLIVGFGENENFLASDIPALLGYTRNVVVLQDGDMAVLTKDDIIITDLDGNPVHRDRMKVKWNVEDAQKGGYKYFMSKEIHEQPDAVSKTLTGRIKEDGSGVDMSFLGFERDSIGSIDQIVVIACGTASYAGQVGKFVLEGLARIHTEVDLASEFRYRDPIIGPNTLALVISQSGETADTLAGLREAKKRGAKVLAITNVVDSSVAREADYVFYTWAGPEIAVASTKAYMTQLVSLYLIAIDLAVERGKIENERAFQLVNGIKYIPSKIEEIFRDHEKWMEKFAQRFVDVEEVFFLGRGVDYATCMEGALKLKEISYIHAEAYAAGELKHGTLALVTEKTPVISVLTQPELKDKTLSNLKEVKARGAWVFAVALGEDENISKSVDEIIHIPEVDPILAPMLSVVPLQLFAYYVACVRGNDVDRPRNLAKSVTVE